MSPGLIPKLLDTDLENARNLNELLREERSCLETRDVKALDDILARKAALLADMERNDRARREQLEEAGFAANREGLQDYCQQIARQQEALGREDSNRLSETCEILFQELSICQELTEINGTIVSRSRNNNSRVLDILRGRSDEADTYSESGDQGGQRDSRPLGSA